MINSLNLKYGHLIAHFVPGLIVLLSVILSICDLGELECICKEYSVIAIVLGSILSLAVGLVLDAIRYLITYLIIHLIHSIHLKYFKVELPVKIDISMANEEDRKYYDWIIENNFRFHQFYGNLSLALCVSFLLLLPELRWNLVIIVVGLSVSCALASIITYKTTIELLKDRFCKDN